MSVEILPVFNISSQSHLSFATQSEPLFELLGKKLLLPIISKIQNLASSLFSLPTAAASQDQEALNP